jgi:hypothetical protein
MCLLNFELPSFHVATSYYLRFENDRNKTCTVLSEMAVKLSALRSGKKKKSGLRCARHSWEMTLNIGLGASIDNMQSLKRIREKAGEANTESAEFM